MLSLQTSEFISPFLEQIDNEIYVNMFSIKRRDLFNFQTSTASCRPGLIASGLFFVKRWVDGPPRSHRNANEKPQSQMKTTVCATCRA